MSKISIRIAGSATYELVDKKNYLGALESCDQVNNIITINSKQYVLNTADDSIISTPDTATDGPDRTPVAISTTRKITKLVTTADRTGLFTLANGEEGQKKIFVFVSKGGAVQAFVSMFNNLNGGNLITFTNVGDNIELIFLGTKWFVLGTPSAVVTIAGE